MFVAAKAQNFWSGTQGFSNRWKLSKNVKTLGLHLGICELNCKIACKIDGKVIFVIVLIWN